MNEPRLLPTENQSHTPGPWHVGEMNHYGRIEIRTDGCWYIGSVAPGLPAGQVEANARLIAAAPDLLEVCKYLATLKDLLCDCGDPDCATVRLHAAIAKAEGRS